MAYIATDRTGRFLLGASYPGHKVTVSPIGPPGTVQPAHQVLPDHPNAHSILADAANRNVIVPTLGNDSVNQFKFDAATGKLTPNAPPSVRVKEKAGPRHFAFHPNGKIVYVLGELDGAVYVFDYDAATGQLKEKQSVSALPPDFQGKPSAADLHITPDGKFLYGSERTSSTLAGFKVDPATGRSRPSAACRPRSSRAASTSTRPGAICSRSASSPTACRATASTPRAASSPSSRNTRWARTRTGSRSSTSLSGGPDMARPQRSRPRCRDSFSPLADGPHGRPSRTT